MQPELLAEQDTTLLFDFVSVLLLKVNCDIKEKHQDLVSFYKLAPSYKEGCKYLFDLKSQS